MKKAKKIFKIISVIFITIIILYCIIMVIQKTIFRKENPSVLGFRNFIVLSGSMRPTLNIGDIIIIRNSKNIKENDIISFKLQNTIVTHRVSRIVEDNGKKIYITKGDANSTEDLDLVKEESILGKFCFRIPLVGKFILFLQSKIGITMLIVIMIIIFFINNVGGIKSIKNMGQKGRHE